jgi:hypothetical protein
MLHQRRVLDAFVIIEQIYKRIGGFDVNLNLTNNFRKIARDALRVGIIYQCSQLNKSIMDNKIDAENILHPAILIYRAA